MYFVDRKVIEERLHYMAKMTPFIKTVVSKKEELTDQLMLQLALERAAHVVIEAIIDVGNQMIDGFIMRDPGSYEDIIDILGDEQVLSEQEVAQIKPFIQLRKLIVSHYTTPSLSTIIDTYTLSAEAIHHFPSRVRTYLEEQLGPVSAFLPHNEHQSE